MNVAEELRNARERTLELTIDLADHEWMGPRLPIVNPVLWEVGHIAWFQELWTVRRRNGAASIRPDADALYDSTRVAHDTRWDLPLPDRAATLEYMRDVLARTLDAVGDGGSYFHWLALFHEDMHGEALAYTRQTLAYPRPAFATGAAAGPAQPTGGALPGDVEVPGARYMLGATPEDGFVFDNEKWAHPVDVPAFRIARAAVTNEEYLRFVEARGYEDRRWWNDDGWRWRNLTGAAHPVYWRRVGGDWHIRRHDQFEALAPHHPVIHVSWYEADAYCRWARRRLPTEAEWELAASTMKKRRYPWGDAMPDGTRANLDGRFTGPVDVGALSAGDSACGCRQMIGNVWEWTASDFRPFPGFVVDPYKEYSEPWFATPHKVLRGGCWATRGRLLRNTWRNFYPPERGDVLAGFRTCAVR